MDGETPAFSAWVVELDFEARSYQETDLARARIAMAAKRFVWIDVDVHDPVRAAAPLAALELADSDVIDDALSEDPGTVHARYPQYLHMAMAGCRLRGRDFQLERVDAVVGEGYLLTIHRGPVEFLTAVKRDYRDDFLHHARTPSFLVYELWDHLLENYDAVQEKFEEIVAKMQARLMEHVDAKVFAEVSELGADLLNFRKVLRPARTVLTDLSSRKTRFVSEATQPFLGNMIGRVERILQDLLTAREILSDSMNLHMTVVGHRTNEVMRRLTVVSVIFLPLTFLVGVYGMNFDVQPELHWRVGYGLFWGMALTIAIGLLILMSKKRLL